MYYTHSLYATHVLNAVAFVRADDEGVLNLPVLAVNDKKKEIEGSQNEYGSNRVEVMSLTPALKMN